MASENTITVNYMDEISEEGNHLNEFDVIKKGNYW